MGNGGPTGPPRARQRPLAHASVLFIRALDEHPELDDGRERDAADPDYVKALDERFGRFGGQWHRKRLDELVREVEEAVDERYETSFWKLFRFVNHHNNYILHHSAVGIEDVVKWDDPDDTPEVIVGPGRAARQSALWAATWCYGLLVLGTLRRLSPERADDFAGLLDDIHRAFVVFKREQVKDVGRNDLCPCASGKKFKHCHGPYVQ